MEADALTIDIASIGPSPRRIVANLPYNISTALLTRWLHVIARDGPAALESMTLMFQKEVAARLLAPPRSSDYGRLSVLTQVVCSATRLFDIPPTAFVPPPKVVSTVVRLVPHAALPRMADGAPLDLRALEAVTAAAFGQRRKMLRTSLRAAFADPEATLAACGIAGTLRAEDLGPSSFVAIASEKSPKAL
jgi:16S rRNA (adenine1518-N6/adenine1519-N6)-dimethyltransferase